LINFHRTLVANKAASNNADSGNRQRHALCSAIDSKTVAKRFV
jgi:hypothetical protein